MCCAIYKHQGIFVVKIKINPNYFYVLVGQGSNYIFPLLIYPYLILKMGMDSFGLFGLSVIITQFFLLIIDYGFGYSSANALADYESVIDKSKYYFSVIGAKIILLFTVSVFSLIGFVFLDKELMLLALLSCVFSILNPFWFLQITSQFKAIAVISVISKVLTVFLIIVFGKGEVFICIFLFSLQYFFISFLGSIFLFGRQLKITSFSFFKSFFILKKGCLFFFSTFATSIYTIFTPIILGLVAAKSEIAVYNAISVIKQGAAGMAAPLIQVIYSKMMALKIPLQDRSYFLNYIKSKILFVVFVVSIASVFCFLFAHYISLFLFNKSNADLIFAIQIMSLTPIMIAFNSSFSSFCLVALGKTNILFKSVGVGSGICLLMAYPISLKFGANGVIMLLFITEIVVGGLMVIFFKKYGFK